jgi:hypothetical protein
MPNSNKHEVWPGRFVTFCNANSSQTCQWLQLPNYPLVFRRTVTHVAHPLGSHESLVVRFEVLWDADRQTLEAAFDEAVCRVASYLNEL